jgi:hypothetical protein
MLRELTSASQHDSWCALFDDSQIEEDIATSERCKSITVADKTNPLYKLNIDFGVALRAVDTPLNTYSQRLMQARTHSALRFGLRSCRDHSLDR